MRPGARSRPTCRSPLAIGGAVVAALLLEGSSACGSAVDRDQALTVLRVSANVGLSEFALRPDVSGSTAYALDLVYDPLDQDVEVADREGTEVVLRRRSSSPHGAATLAAALRFEGLVSARARGEEIVCELASPELVGPFVRNAGFDLGPFFLQEQSRGRILLSAREPLGIDSIEILEVDSSDAWRRLLGHEFDVLPGAPSLYQSQFEGMTSIRTVDIPVSGAIGLFFNTADPALADRAVRRAVARLLDVVPVARIACGDPDCAVTWWSPAAPDPSVALPDRLSLITIDSQPYPLAARVIGHQLRQAGIEVDVDILPVEAIAERGQSGDYQLGLFGLGGSFEDQVRELDRFEAVTRHHAPALERARAEGDLEAARQILAAEVPYLPLFETRLFAAVDRGFCGGRPRDAHSWRWLSELYPCPEGER